MVSKQLPVVAGAAGGEEGGHDVGGGEGGQEDGALPGAGDLTLLPLREQGAGAGGDHEVTLRGRQHTGTQQ